MPGPTDPACTNSAKPDVMGYHTESDIPNYWTYAKDFVLQDHMFEPNASWSLPAHLFLVSEWSAYCTQADNPSSCVNASDQAGRAPPERPPVYGASGSTNGGGNPKHANSTPAQAHLRLDRPHLPAAQAPCELGLLRGERDGAGLREPGGETCAPVRQNANTPGIWNPLPWFNTVQADDQLGNIQDVDNFYARRRRARCRRCRGSSPPAR